MCGIAGIVSRDLHHLAAIQAMTKAQAHRGPDGMGHLLLGTQARAAGVHAPPPVEGDFLALGHLRLAIVDTTDTGAQPMPSADGQDWITYNGEVYNHIELRAELEALGQRFHGHSDTEVILAAYREWGLRCFSRFNGMWAIGLWDGRQRKLVLARDRLGVKPLCYGQAGRTLVFASEFKGLLATGLFERKLNVPLAMDFLRWSAVNHTNESFFSGLQSLPPGHYAVVSPEVPDVRPVPFWRLEAPAAAEPTDAKDAARKFAELFRDAVRLRLRSDVPVGSCLSGGLDSSAIVCQAAALSDPGDGSLHTFNAASEDPRFDERPWCNIINERVGATAHFSFPQHQDFADELDQLIWHQEEPFTTASIYAQWQVMRAARRQGIPVMLDGQGADEGLCGYRKFYLFHLRDLARRGKVAALLAEIWNLWRHGDRGLLRWREGTRYLPTWLRNRIPTLAAVLRPQGAALWEQSRLQLAGAASVAQRQVDDLLRFSVPSLLRYEDRNSMAWSIESRVPFLDYRLVEWLVALPAGVKLAKGRTKAVMRDALRGLVPDAVLDRRDKMGFVTAQEEWMRGPLRPQIEACFAEPDFPLAGWIDARAVLEQYSRWLAGEPAVAQQDLFRLFVLARWMRRFGVTA